MFCLGICCMLISDLAEVQAKSAGGPDMVVFDIPAQSLITALHQYGDITGREVLYNASLAKGRHTQAVKGVFAPETALEMLLDGTGLSARFMEDASFVLVPEQSTDQAQSAAEPVAAQRWYYARIQTSVGRALCASSEIGVEKHRLTALFWLSDSGAVARYERLSVSDDTDRDQRIDSVLRRAEVGLPPPPGFEQPVLVMIRPHEISATVCGGSRWPAVRESP